MSNAGQAVLGIVGAVAGFFVGGPQGAVYGFQLGYLAGTALFPTQLPAAQGPRMGDGQQTVSTVGAPIPWIHGTQAVGGIVIWASPIREVSNTTTAGGKGAPEQKTTTYTYFRSFAILLCESPEFDRPIGGIRRVWANGKPIFDLSPPQGFSIDDLPSDWSGTDQQAFIGRQIESTEWAEKMTVYLGTEDQMPDPVIESFEGVGNVPAFRGYAYVVFDDVELKPEDGNRMPASWKFEVYEEGDEEVAVLDQYAQEVLHPWISTDGNPTNSANVNVFRVGSFPATGITGQEPSTVAYESTLGEAIGELQDYWGGVRNYVVYSHQRTIGDEPAFTDGPRVASDADRCLLMLLPQQPEIVYTVPQASALTCGTIPPEIWFWGGGHWGAGSADLLLSLPELFDGCSSPPPDIEYLYDGCFRCDWTIFFNVECLIEVVRSPAPPPPPCVIEIPEAPDFCVTAEGAIVPAASEWQYDDSQNYHALRSWVPGNNISDPTCVSPLGPIRPVGHAQDTQAWWEAQYASAVARFEIEAGLVYGVDYPTTQAYGWRLGIGLQTIETQPISLATIVRRINERAGERVGFFEFDVSDLEPIFVVGYQVSRPSTARAAIEPLRQVGFFDVVESAIQLRYPTRGKAAVDTLYEDDLAAHFAEEARPSAITTRKLLELELPRQMRVHYQNPERDYEPGEELSPERFDIASESVVDVDLAVAISPDKAAQIAEVLYRDAWAGRWLHLIQVDISKAFIEPADAVLVPVDGAFQRVRVPALTERLPNLRALELIRDDDGQYVSTAVGAGNGRPPNQIQFVGPVFFLVLDLPPLTTDVTGADLYAVAYPAIINGAFTGALIQRSTDGGGGFSIVGSVTNAAPVATVITPMGDGPTTIFDEGGELLIEMIYGDGQLTSRPEADVLDGANAFAVGVHGRWEVAQFKTVELVTGRIYRLTGLLRGRRGTEHYVGTGEAGDQFVMLDNAARIPLAVTEIGASILYRASPIGKALNATAQAFTSAGVVLEPFSPVHIEAQRNDDGDITITWVRRDRLMDETDPTESPITMSESVEDYEVEILDSNGAARRVISVSATQALYTAQMQADDFGALQDPISIAVYQMSAAVGRGVPGTATL